MLVELRLKNYRGFREHRVPLRATTVAVGRNNAGKSTIVEALRILALVVTRFDRLVVKPVPAWLDAPRSEVGVAPALEKAGLNLDSLFHGYGEPPAEITGIFESGHSVTVYLGQEARIHGVLKDKKGSVLGTPGRMRRASLTSLAALPQLGPVALEEKILMPEYVRASMSSSLASIHFRNQINLLNERLGEFKRLAEETWPGLRIVELQGKGKAVGTRLALLIKDSDFVAEVAWMGHGLQMWLQTIWFLTRTPKASTVVLDEPDVYMHPDLQRRLFRFVKERFAQVIVATHSVEIMQEADPANILIVDRRHGVSRFADSQPAVQRLVEQIGSISHIQLSRLWHAKKCILVEGEDLSLLAIIHNLLFPDAAVPLDTLPTVPLGGWTGWPYAMGSALLLENAVGENVRPYCLLDSDYHSPAAIEERQRQAKVRGVQLHVWNRKELENYLLVPETIARLVSAKGGGAYKPAPGEIAAKIDDLASAERDVVFDAYGQEFFAEDRAKGLAGANDKARNLMAALWQTPEGRAARAPGKALISTLSAWAKAKFGVSFGPAALAREMRPNEVPEELRRVLTAIDQGDAFPDQTHEVSVAMSQRALPL